MGFVPTALYWTAVHASRAKRGARGRKGCVVRRRPKRRQKRSASCKEKSCATVPRTANTHRPGVAGSCGTGRPRPDGFHDFSEFDKFFKLSSDLFLLNFSDMKQTFPFPSALTFM